MYTKTKMLQKIRQKMYTNLDNLHNYFNFCGPYNHSVLQTCYAAFPSITLTFRNILFIT